MSKPKLGIFSLTGCGGDQLQILNMEDQLLDLVSRFDIVDFQDSEDEVHNPWLGTYLIHCPELLLKDLDILIPYTNQKQQTMAFL